MSIFRKTTTHWIPRREVKHLISSLKSFEDVLIVDYNEPRPDSHRDFYHRPGVVISHVRTPHYENYTIGVTFDKMANVLHASDPYKPEEYGSGQMMTISLSRLPKQNHGHMFQGHITIEDAGAVRNLLCASRLQYRPDQAYVVSEEIIRLVETRHQWENNTISILGRIHRVRDAMIIVNTKMKKQRKVKRLPLNFERALFDVGSQEQLKYLMWDYLS